MNVTVDGIEVHLPECLLKQIERHIEKVPDIDTVFCGQANGDIFKRANVYESFATIADYLNDGWHWKPEEDCFYVMYDGRANAYIIQKGSYLSMGCPVFKTKSDATLAIKMCETYGIDLKRLYL